MPSKSKVGRDLTKGGRGVTKRGWRSARPGSWQTKPEYMDAGTERMRVAMATEFPYHINKMSNGAWQFFCMGDDWFEKSMSKPKKNESIAEWADRVDYLKETD